MTRSSTDGDRPAPAGANPAPAGADPAPASGPGALGEIATRAASALMAVDAGVGSTLTCIAQTVVATVPSAHYAAVWVQPGAATTPRAATVINLHAEAPHAFDVDDRDIVDVVAAVCAFALDRAALLDRRDGSPPA